MRILTALCLATALTLPLSGIVQAADTATITVSGEGRVDSRPDMASISLGVTTQGMTAAEAMTANSAQLAKVLDNLRAAGIADRDLQTTGLSLNPNWQSDSSGNNSRIVGYIASNMLNVRVRALDGLGQVLDVAVQDGANTLNGVSFGLSKPEPALDEARKLAVADALHRATLLTEAAGTKLGRVISITEGGGYYAPAPMFKADSAMAAAVPVAEGEVTTSISVTIAWEIAQ
ncbi:SIMPL domain-containing protein [Rhodobacter ferrooxidans]|uniref:Outer membrane protein n=1 Tax=Rhodobacter ferrooxidans TaxID=371731 RepID=C8S441_9RHOB|nr:SIMPL domain-containing protein [Rhodobacter sp. SW2]EEW24207.1 protein of unknown function DUF541 [Rhodobacter sp. SW2]